MTDMPGADGLTATVRQCAGLTEVTVAGVVDLATTPLLEATLDEAIGAESRHRPAIAGPGLLLDLTDVVFLASAGLRILADTHDRMGGAARFAIVTGGPATARPIRLTRLDEILAVYPTAEEARLALRDAARS